MENNLKEIKEFINQWKEKALNYYHKAIVDYKAKRKEIDDNYPYWSDDYTKAMRKLHDEYNQTVINLASPYYSPKEREEKLIKMIKRDAKAKETTLIARVNKLVGSIVKALHLTVGANGELNGYIKGENGTCKIETIVAGGYNIQCSHYRVLVHKVSA